MISSTTIGARLNSFDAAIVLFRISVPRGFVSDTDVSNPLIEPVASITKSYIFSIFNSCSSFVFTPCDSAISSLFLCFPTNITSKFRAFKVNAVVAFSFGCVAHGILVPQPRIEPAAPALAAES